MIINAMFCFKYLYRIMPAVGYASVPLYALFIYVIYQLYIKHRLLLSLKTIFAGGVVYILLFSIILFFIPKETLNVDRWEMIELFWNSTREGHYPYGIASPGGNYPGPMPFYFILCYPFYMIGEIGLVTIGGIVIWFIHTYRRYDRNNLSFIVLLVASSLAICWEILVRSTIFFNTAIFALFFFWLHKISIMKQWQFYLSAIVGGVLFSTRNVYAIPLVIWGIYALYTKEVTFIRMVIWVQIFIVAFIITFLPFVLMDPAQFLVMNPFIIQGSFLLPFSWILGFIFLSCIFGLLCKNFNDVIFYTGLSFFLTITAHLIYGISNNGLSSLMNDGADISYYIFSFPFLLSSIIGLPVDEKEDKGKIKAHAFS